MAVKKSLNIFTARKNLRFPFSPLNIMADCPFSSSELQLRWTDMVEYARRADDARLILSTRELNKEVKEAYQLVLRDSKWQLCMKIKDLWVWMVKEEEIKSKETEVSGKDTPAPQ